MADTLRLLGSYQTTPLLGPTSGVPTVDAPIDDTVQLTKKVALEYVLDTDDPVSVSLAGLTALSVLFVTVIGSKVRVRITSADGATQAVPVDDLFMLISRSVPITAIDLTRAAAGVETTVNLFLGQSA